MKMIFMKKFIQTNKLNSRIKISVFKKIYIKIIITFREAFFRLLQKVPMKFKINKCKC